MANPYDCTSGLPIGCQWFATGELRRANAAAKIFAAKPLNHPLDNHRDRFAAAQAQGDQAAPQISRGERVH
jgi:hypothetical protein